MVEQKITEFILQLSGLDNIDKNINLFESSILNSIAVLDVIGFIEKEYDISIEDDELDMDHFNSINALADFVSSKKNIRK